MPNGRVYYLIRKVGEPQFKLAMREGVDGAERVLVDPQELTRTTGVPHAINHYTPSWDGRTLAYGISSGGSENASLHLMDIATGRQLVNRSRAWSRSPSWAPDNRHLPTTSCATSGATRRIPSSISTPPSSCSTARNPTSRRGDSSARWSTNRWRSTGSTTR